MNANVTPPLIKNNDLKPLGLNYWEHLVRGCLTTGGHDLTAADLRFLVGILQQLRWCPLTTGQQNQLLDLSILVREGAQ